MKPEFRRVTTGLDASGKSCVTDDALISDTAPGGSLELWYDKTALPGAADATQAAPPFYPRSNESIFRIVQLPAVSGSLNSADLVAFGNEFFEANQIPECRVDVTRHPFMHRTPTIDYVIVLSGSVSLLLDRGEPVPLGPMDTVVQRTTNHSWINTGREPAFLLVVMLGSPQAAE